MAVCPACHRPVAVARAACLYCGARLPEQAQAEARKAADSAREPRLDPARPEERFENDAVLLDLTGADPEKTAHALAWSRYETELRLRRGGWQLVQFHPPEVARSRVERLLAAGLKARQLPAAQIRAAMLPLVVVGGVFDGKGNGDGDVFRLRTAEEELALDATDVLLLVHGPITRERQSQATPARLVGMAAPERGYLYHVHRHSAAAPLELDPEIFEFGAPGPALGSALLTLKEWLEVFTKGVPVDDDFRYQTPALAPAAPVEAGPGVLLSALAAGNSTRGSAGNKAEPRAVLDNHAQFRLYSALRGALARSGGTGGTGQH